MQTMRSTTGAAALLTFFALGGIASACANYSSSAEDDEAVRAALRVSDEAAFLLISRQFPHHGPAYWKALERESREAAKRSDDGSVGARDDLAVAILKQGRFDEARRLLLAMNEERPNRYRTLSNLGVLEKKAGRFEQSAAYLERALVVKPGGHMGLGDYYLRAARWQAGAAKVTPTQNFLGIGYDLPAQAQAVNEEHLRTLIHNDRDFPDVYLVFGDQLLARKQVLLAGYAYMQATRLGHPADAVLKARMLKVQEDLHLHAGIQASVDLLQTALFTPLQEATTWSRAFEVAQEGLLAGGTQAASLKAVAASLKRAPVKAEAATELLILRTRHERGRRDRVTNKDRVLFALFAAAGFLAVALLVRVLRRRLTGAALGSI